MRCRKTQKETNANQMTELKIKRSTTKTCAWLLWNSKMGMKWCLIHGYLNASKCLDSKKFIKLMSCRPAFPIGRSNCLLTIIILNQCPWREVFFWKIYSTLLFLKPFSMVLRMLESGYRLAKGNPEIAVSHLLFKDDLRLRFTCSRFKCVVPAMKKGRTWTAVVLISQ